VQPHHLALVEEEEEVVQRSSWFCRLFALYNISSGLVLLGTRSTWVQGYNVRIDVLHAVVAFWSVLCTVYG